MVRLIRNEGSLDARIVLVGEAGGAQEAEAGRPFVGPSGSVLAQWWRAAGLQRSDFYITNVVPVQPRGNKLETLDTTDVTRWKEELHERLALLADPWLIVPCGNLALSTLLGKQGITKHRGSIYEYTDRRGRKIKCIPTIHPAATFRETDYVRCCQRDWLRIGCDAKFRDLQLPTREHYIRPNLDDLRVYVDDTLSHAHDLAIDIETPGRVLTCIGFSCDPLFSITVPTTRDYWRDEYEQAMMLIRALLASDIEKIFQNGLFDMFYLGWDKLPVSNWQWDTMAMHHALCPNDKHSLAYMASCDTREPFWKDWEKDIPKGQKIQDAFWIYNGKDVAVTYELKETYYDRLRGCEPDGLRGRSTGGQDRVAFYQRHYRDMFLPLLGMSMGGIRADAVARDREYNRLTTECTECLAELSTIAGEPLHAKKGLSNAKLQRFLYEQLKLPVQRNRATGRATTDESAVLVLMQKYGDKLGEAGRLILDFRRKSKLSQFLDPKIADSDGRVRCEYRFTTETGRLSSSQNPRGTGANLQNQDHEVLSMYVPDPGHVFLKLDLSQAEDRWVKVIAYAHREQHPAAQDYDWPEVLRRARAMPWENDEHWRAADAIYGLPREQMTKALHRQLGKRTRHALNYGMGAVRHARECQKQGLNVTAAQAQQMLDRLLKADPYIAVYQLSRRTEAMKNRRLINTWGRIYDVEFDRFEDTLFRQLYAFQPQSEVADVTNQWGVIVAHELCQGRRSRLVAQKHDEVLLSVHPDEAWELYGALKKSLEQPRVYRDVELVVPADVSVGRSWGEAVEFKRPPTKKEFMATIKELLYGSK